MSETRGSTTTTHMNHSVAFYGLPVSKFRPVVKKIVLDVVVDDKELPEIPSYLVPNSVLDHLFAIAYADEYGLEVCTCFPEVGPLLGLSVWSMLATDLDTHYVDNQLESICPSSVQTDRRWVVYHDDADCLCETHLRE